ncbi:MAG: 16S rRNA (uracil(1498)-N(3))-methyltransferase [Kiritimatiellia bacterium]
MNRILFEREEIQGGLATFGGVRAEHVLGVLHGTVGQVLKTGEIDGPVGTAEIVGIGGPGGPDGPRVTVRCAHTVRSRRPWIDLLLAPPRPRVLKRLLPQLAAMGVGRILLVGAEKVEKAFWGATLLKPEHHRPLLIDGLMQAGTSILPTLAMRRNFRRFVTDELDALFPASVRIVAHPHVASGGARPAAASGSGAPLLAIGPEGGWTDEEVALLAAHGFARRSLGPRILRTDTATVAMLAQLMQEYDRC